MPRCLYILAEHFLTTQIFSWIHYFLQVLVNMDRIMDNFNFRINSCLSTIFQANYMIHLHLRVSLPYMGFLWFDIFFSIITQFPAFDLIKSRYCLEEEHWKIAELLVISSISLLCLCGVCEKVFGHCTVAVDTLHTYVECIFVHWINEGIIQRFNFHTKFIYLYDCSFLPCTLCDHLHLYHTN